MKLKSVGWLTAFLLSLPLSVMAQSDLDASGPTTSVLSPKQKPELSSLRRAGSTNIDLRLLPQTGAGRKFRPEHRSPPLNLGELAELDPGATPPPPALQPAATRAPMPGTIANFLGLDFANFGAGRPPDTVGDVGPNHYIQAVNTSIGIYRKSDNVRVAAFSFDTFMSQGSFGNLCDADNFGDPVVLYDTFEDRWVITDFAFQLDGGNNVVAPPGAFECFAVSKTSDPVSGGWNFYSLQFTDALNDYPKLGIWPDGIYMSANMFQFQAGGSFVGTRVWALNKAQMYANAPSVQVVSFNPPSNEFTLLPANARLQTGTPPVGSPNYFAVIWNFANAVSVYKFAVDWNSVSTASFTGPFTAIAPTSLISGPSTVPAQSGAALDTSPLRLMMQNQYTNIGGAESIWLTHTVRHSTTAGIAVPRYYQLNVTGGTIAGTTVQAANHEPDTTINRFTPSLAVDRQGNMAIGYSASNASLFPAIRYAGRLAGDPVNTLPQTETSLVEGTGSQTGSSRWGDYAAMSLDPNGCTFWMTSEYYITTGTNWQTRIGSFRFPGCTDAGSGTLQGTVTSTPGGSPIAGATVALGARTTTTNASGVYTFSSLPSGTYPSLSVSAAGFSSASANTIVITDSATTTRNFALSASVSNACLTDTSQADFQTGTINQVDLLGAPGDVRLSNPIAVNQQNNTVGTSGVGITVTTWGGQTFTPSATGTLTQVALNLFCSGCTGTTPNLTLSVRATSAGLPTGADLASTTITGFSSGAASFYSATFASPPTLTAGTQYALVIRPTANPSPGTYALTRSGTATTGADVYAGGTRVSGATSGTVWSIPLTGGVNSDAGFRVFLNSGFVAAGDHTSSNKDANPASGLNANWGTLSWNGSTPASTNLRFQAAASNSQFGPFSFVGPDGTAGTFYTGGSGSLSQFNGFRYVRYKAYLTSSNSAATPVLNDVTVCYTNISPNPDFSLSKSDGGATVVPGGTATYTLSYGNTGASASGVVLTETVPAETTFNSAASTAGWSCTPNNNAGSTCTLSLGSVAYNASGSATFAVTVASGVSAGVSQLSNTASIADDGSHGADTNPSNNTATDTTPVTATPDLTLSKSDGGASANLGGNVTYALLYANVGNQGASGVTITETVPANSSFNSALSNPGFTCTPNNNAGSTCTLSLGTLAAGSSSGGNFAITVAGSVPGGTTAISNTASIADDAANGVDPTPANNSSSDTTPLNVTDVAISITDSPDPVNAGSALAYTVTVTNNGPLAAANSNWLGTLPSGTVFASISPAAGWSCTTPSVGLNGTISCSRASFAVGSAAFTVNVSVAGNAAAGTLLYPVSVTTTTAETSSANNSAQASTTLTRAAELSVTGTDSPDPVNAGQNLSYTVTASNAGPSIATGMALSMALSANTGFVSLTPPAAWSCTTPAVGTSGTINCTADVDVAVGSAVFSPTVSVNAGVASGTVLSMTANVSSADADTNTANNQVVVQTTVSQSANLSVSLTDTPDPVTAGQNLSYAITVNNAGPSSANNVSLTDTLPANTTFVSLTSAAGWSCTTPAVGASGTVSCSVATLATGNAAFTLVVQVSPGATAGSTISNTATVSASTTDPNSGNNSATATTTVAQSADLSVSITDTPDPVTAGQNLSYAITVNNAGPSTANTVSLTDTLPANTTFVSLTSAAGWSCTTPAVGASGTVSCSVAALATGSAAFTLVVQVSSGAAAGTTISNTAAVSASTTDSNSSNNSATATTTVAQSADVSVSITDTPDPVTAGQNLSYAITVNNAGPSAATSASLTDTLPANTTFVSLTSAGGWSCTTPAVGASGTVSCSVASLTTGSAAFTLVVQVSPGATAGSTLSNTANVAASSSDPNSANNSATATTTVAQSADLSVSVTDTPDPVTAGQNLSYAITVNNAGPSTANTVSLTDTLPANTSFVSLTAAGGWSCTSPAVGASGTVSCSVASLATGSASFTLVVQVSPAATAGSTLSNTATVAASTTDPNSGNNSATATTTVAQSADVSVSMTDSPDPVTPGQNLSFAISVSNAGPSNASTVSLSDTLPANTTFVSLTSAGGWSCTTPAVGASGSVSCSIATLAPGSASFTLVVQVANGVAGGTVISNTATVAALSTDPVSGNNSATTSTTAGQSADVSVTIVDTPDPVTQGQNLSYAITVNNAGPSSANTVSLTDTLPANTTFVSLTSAAGWSCTTPSVGSGGGINCSLASMAVGSASFTLVVRVSTGPGGSSIANTAVVSTSTTDPNAANNSATSNTALIRAVDLEVRLTANPDPVVAGQQLTYGLTAVNNGPVSASAVTVSTTVPANTSFVSLPATGGFSCTTPAVGSSGAVTCTLSSMIVDSFSISIVVQVAANLASGTVLNNTATIAAADPDFDNANNSANLSIGVQGGPTISAPGSGSLLEDQSSIPLSITVGDAETAPAALVLSATSSNQSLITDASLASGLGGSGSARSLTLTPVADAFGTATITLTVTDGNGLSASAPINLTVTAVNDAPSVSTLGNQTHAAASTGAQSVPGFITALSAGPANESAQLVSLQVQELQDADNVVSAISLSGTTLNYTLSGSNGVAVIQLSGQDNGGTANGGVDTFPAQEFRIQVGAGVDLVTRIVRLQPPLLPLTNPGNGGATLANYAITVSNFGTLPATGVNLLAPAPVGLTGVLWICSVSPSGVCSPANGSTSVNNTFDLPIGATATTQLSGTIIFGIPWLEISASASVPVGVSLINANDDRTQLIEPIEGDGVFKNSFE